MKDLTRVIAIDLAKSVFHVCVLRRHGQKVLSEKRMGRKALAAWLAKQRPAIVAMEACGGAHHWARLAQSLGHDARIVPPRRVTPYRQGHKTDGKDALAIGVAACQAQIKTVGVKSLDQQSLQSDKRVQEHLSNQWTASGNALRALVAEFGVVIPKGKAALRRALPEILEDADNGLPLAVRESLALLWQHWRALCETVRASEVILEQRVTQSLACQRLDALPGVGPKNAIGLYLRLGDGQHFKNGREASACIGVTPKQHSTGGKVRLGGIGKHCGDQRLRSALILGSRAKVEALKSRPARTAEDQWLKSLIQRRGAGRAAVALANKNVRVAWAMLRHDSAYRPRPLDPARPEATQACE